MSTYLSFEITRVRSGYLARRRTPEAIWQLGPSRTLVEIQRKIDEHYSSVPFEEW